MKTEHNSRSPNPVLADACFKAGYIDTWGRGTLKIYKACDEAGLPEPRIIEKDGGIEVTLFKAVASERATEVPEMISEDVRNDLGTISERSRNKFGTKVEATFKSIAEDTSYTAAQIAAKLDVTPRTVENHQAKLKKDRYIERQGDKIGGYWKISGNE